MKVVGASYKHTIFRVVKHRNRLGFRTFRTKTLNFTRFMHLNWLVKIELREPGPPGRLVRG